MLLPPEKLLPVSFRASRVAIYVFRHAKHLSPQLIEDVGYPWQHTFGANTRSSPSSSKPEHRPLRSLSLPIEVSGPLEGEYNRGKVVTDHNSLIAMNRLAFKDRYNTWMGDCPSFV